jgi:hypothetical protein
MLMIPGAMEAGLSSAHFWGSMIVSLILAGLAAFPINRWLIARGRGHAVVHEYHGHHAPPTNSDKDGKGVEKDGLRITMTTDESLPVSKATTLKS